MRWVAVALVGLGCGKRAPDEAPTPPPRTKVVPLAGGDTFAQQGPCLVATVTELRKHPHWTIRLDDRRSFEHNIDAPAGLDGVIERDADGARWRDGLYPQGVVALDAAAVAAIDQALGETCQEDPDWLRPGSDIRWFEIGFGIAGATSLHLPESSRVTRALSPIFDAGRAAHVKAMRTRARTTVLAADGFEHTAKGWKKKHVVVDLRAGSTDADAVAALDWLVDQPEALDRGPMVLVGTLTIEDKPRPIAISLMVHGDHERIALGSLSALAAVWHLVDSNYFADLSDFHMKVTP